MKNRPLNRSLDYRPLRLLTFLTGLMAVTSVAADSLTTLENLDQDQFVEFAETLTAATHYKAVSPPESMGILGIDVGLVVSSTDVSGDLFDLASDGEFDGTELIIPRVHVHKGLPFGLDLGASVGVIPDTDARVLAAEVRYALVEGGMATPALGVRASYAQVLGIDDLDMQNYALELGVSKGFLFATPYAGIGIVRGSADPNTDNGLSSESYELRKLVVGATVNLGVALTLEADRTGDHRTYSAKIGFRF